MMQVMRMMMMTLTNTKWIIINLVLLLVYRVVYYPTLDIAALLITSKSYLEFNNILFLSL